MPDVVRSDSQRSDSSLRPRVSFNRDVHVKRIVPRNAQSDSNVENDLVTHPGKRNRSKQPKKEFPADQNSLGYIDKHNSVSRPRAEQFFTLPRKRKGNEETGLNVKALSKEQLNKINGEPPKKPQRIFIPKYKNQDNDSTLDSTLTKKSTKRPKPKKVYLNRSASDVANSKSKNKFEKLNDKSNVNNDREHTNSLRAHKKQLSPIVEVSPCDDYCPSHPFDSYEENKENKANVNNSKIKSRHIGNEKQNKALSKKSEKKFIVIDIDEAEDITETKRSKLRNSLFGKKLKSITKRSKRDDEQNIVSTTTDVGPETQFSELKESDTNSKQAQNYVTQNMIHSSQQPVKRPPLTKGRTVDVMVKRLSRDTSPSPSPPPRPTRMVIPNQYNYHNNNQPFSYTRGLSPEKYVSDDNFTSSSEIPIIYAQVVCSNDQKGSLKQTVHTSYSKRYSHSDSDEGLGNEETSNSIRTKHGIHKTVTHFGDDIQPRQESFTSKVINLKSSDHALNYNSESFFTESNQRGCADGMESKRTENSLERMKRRMDAEELDSSRNSLSARRDLLESRISRRIHDKKGAEINFEKTTSSSPSPIAKYSSDLDHQATKSYYSTDEPKSFDSYTNYEESHFANKDDIIRKQTELQLNSRLPKNLCKSTPNIYNNYSTERFNGQYAYHDSLQRDRYRRDKRSISKNKLGDSGIETDIKPYSNVNFSSRRNRLSPSDNHVDSEDEGFASSLLIASEKQHTEDNINRYFTRKEYDSDAPFYGEDDSYHQTESRDYKVSKRYNDEYVPRERNIDDGSHFDPRIDKELPREQHTLKRNDKKPPKPEKKSGLQKMKQLFTRDSKKKKEIPEMVREESLLARYKEYKGKDDTLNNRTEAKSHQTNTTSYYGARKRMPTPSPNSSQRQEDQNTKKPNNWFKSLERISRNSKKRETKRIEPINEKEPEISNQNTSSKSLRFFGDTDSDSDHLRKRLAPKSQNLRKDRIISQSWKDLNSSSEETRNTDAEKRNAVYKSMVDISTPEKEKNSRSNQKPPMVPHSKNVHDVPKSRHNRRKKYEPSSVESSTEGDSSQRSQRSVLYLHAATVGDIPGPAAKYGQRAVSKEELANSDSSRMQTQSKTLSRSFSVLAPWKPRYSHEGRYIDYSQNPNYAVEGGKSESPATSLQDKQIRDKNLKNGSSTLSKISKNKNNTYKASKKDTPHRSFSTLYRKKERTPKENLKYREKEDRKNAVKSHSVESLRNIDTMRKKGNEKNRDISRSMSMPKDPAKTAGWYKSSKKEHHRSEHDMRRV